MYAVADPAPGDAARCPVHPDHEGLAHQIALGHKAPGTAVVAVVAVVAHGEVTALRHLPCTRGQTAEIVRVNHQLVHHGADRLHLQPRRQRDTGAHLGIRPYILLRHGGAVYEDGLVVVLDAVAGQTNDALDVIGRRVLRETEHNHVDALRLVDVVVLEVHDWQAYAVRELKHQKKNTHPQQQEQEAKREAKRLDQI